MLFFSHPKTRSGLVSAHVRSVAACNATVSTPWLGQSRSYGPSDTVELLRDPMRLAVDSGDPEPGLSRRDRKSERIGRQHPDARFVHQPNEEFVIRPIEKGG